MMYDSAAGRTAAKGQDAPLLPASPQWLPPADASVCVNCRLRGGCLGGIAAEAGTTQLRRVIAGRRRIKGGEAAYREGDPFAFLYVVRSGSLKSGARLLSGERVLDFHLPGELVGTDGLAGDVHAATLTALEDSELCAICYDACTSADRGALAFFGRLWDMMSRDLVRQRAHSALLATLSANQRVSAFLVALSGRLRARGYSAHEFHLRMSRAEIGSYLGVTMETVSRTLSSLARRGVVEVDRKHVRIVDPQQLQAEWDADA